MTGRLEGRLYLRQREMSAWIVCTTERTLATFDATQPVTKLSRQVVKCDTLLCPLLCTAPQLMPLIVVLYYQVVNITPYHTGQQPQRLIYIASIRGSNEITP